MITLAGLNLLKELRRGPRTRREQSAFNSAIGIRTCVERFSDNDLIVISENDEREQLLNITLKGVAVLQLCEQLENLGCIFE